MENLQNPIQPIAVDSIACRGVRVQFEYDAQANDFLPARVRLDMVAGTVEDGKFVESAITESLVFEKDQIPPVIKAEFSTMAQRAMDAWAQKNGWATVSN